MSEKKHTGDGGGGADAYHDHDVVFTLYAEPAHVGYADAARQELVQLGLIQQLRVLRLCVFKLDADLLPVLQVAAQIDLPERAAADLATQLVLAPYTRSLHVLIEAIVEVLDGELRAVLRLRRRTGQNLILSLRTPSKPKNEVWLPQKD